MILYTQVFRGGGLTFLFSLALQDPVADAASDAESDTSEEGTGEGEGEQASAE